MSTIVTRAGKGSALTNTELDTNLTNLNTDKLERNGSNAMTSTLPLAAGTTTVPPLLFQAGVLTTTPAAHRGEWDGTALYMTNASAVRKALAYVDQAFFLGTTSIAINRTSGAIALTGITSIDGSAASATTATTATNLAGGVAGALHWQSAAGTSGFTAAGTAGQILQSNGATVPTWVTTLPTAASPAYTGDVTKPSGSLTTTIAAAAVTLAKMANLAANSIIGNNTGAAATPLALTTAQVTAMLDLATSTLKGLVPASGGGTTNYLRADLTWAPVAAGAPDFLLQGYGLL